MISFKNKVSTMMIFNAIMLLLYVEVYLYYFIKLDFIF